MPIGLTNTNKMKKRIERLIEKYRRIAKDGYETVTINEIQTDLRNLIR